MTCSAPKKENLVLAIDSGTQSIRAGLVNCSGQIIDLVKTEIEPYYTRQPGWAEQDPNYYWDKLCATSQTLLGRNDRLKDALSAVTVTTQRLTMINLDKEGRPLRPAIVWLDQRKADIRRVVPPAFYPVLKAARLYGLFEYAVQYCRSNWIRQQQPEIWDQTAKYLFLSGYYTYQLTGEYADSTGNMIGTIPFEVKKEDWSGNRALKSRLFPVEREKLPRLVKPADTLGHITAGASNATGIPKGLPLVAASNDKGCEILGAGCLLPDTACLSFGTTATINTQNKKYVELKPFLPPFPSAIPGQYYSEIAVMRGFWMVSWFKEEFGLPERLEAMESGLSAEELFEKLIMEVPAGSMGLMLQPYWTPGPEMDPYAKGAIVGFSDIHKRSHLYRAMIEGLVYALKEGAYLTEKKNGIPINTLRVSGGGSQSNTIVQITADIFGLPVQRPHTHETALLGAAIDACLGLGLFSDFESAVTAMTRVGRTFEPDKTNNQIYQELYNRAYRRMYPKLKPLYKEIKNITGYPD